MNLLTIFITGLLTGGLTCLAVQGGLLASCLASREEENLQKGLSNKNSAFPIVTFLTAKLVAYTILGFLLGALGSVLQLSLTVKIIMQVAVVIFMAGTALNLLQVHPIFRYFVIQPPRFLTGLIRNQTKSKEFFAPAILGAFTIFIPCGTTQAMMALAIGSGNAIIGAGILAAFILGTSPVFFILGYFATKLGETLHQKFLRVAAVAILMLAVLNFDSALVLSGSSFTLGGALQGIFCTVTFCSGTQVQAAGGGPQIAAANDVTINLSNAGYDPNTVTVKAGNPVTLHLVNINGTGCIQGFVIPKLGVQKVVRTGTTEIVNFTAPSQPQELVFSCSMGMYRGKIEVI